jgi:hypothetical protein
MWSIGKANRLKVHFFLFFTLFVTSIFAVVVYTSFQQVNKMTDILCNTLGIPIAKRAAALVDGDSFERLSQTLDENDPFYEAARLKLRTLKEENRGRRDICLPFQIPHQSEPGNTEFEDESGACRPIEYAASQ